MQVPPFVLSQKGKHGFEHDAFEISINSFLLTFYDLLLQYCECFQHNVHCGLNCRCTNCKNFPEAGPPEGGNDGSTPVGSGTDDGPPREVTIYRQMEEPSMQRRVSLDLATADRLHLTESGGSDDHLEEKKEEHIEERREGGTEEKKETGADRMAIMAAVAMTQLFGGKDGSTHLQASSPNTDGKEDEKSPQVRRVSSESPTSETEETPPAKRAKVDHEDDRDDPHLISSASSSSATVEKGPSPTMFRTPHMHCIKGYPPPTRFPYGHGHPHGVSPGYPGPPMHHHSITTPVATPPRSHHPMGPPPHHYHHHPHTHHHRSISPHMPMYGAGCQPPQPLPPHQMTPSQPPPSTPMRASPTYEDVIRSSGLPKSLSFRKICSKCGKTRGEHGELGFGNKCVYQDCGKCGAGVQMHLKAKVPMGILCTLTVEDGATPGAAASYERKIRDLANRAELQKEMQKRKHDATHRAVEAGAP